MKEELTIFSALDVLDGNFNKGGGAMEGTPRGRIGWYELYTSDPEAAKVFYPDVTGWTVQVWDEGETPYTMWMAEESPVGGVMQLPPEAQPSGAPNHWVMYVTTPDADSTIERAKELGGAVVWGALEIPKVGRVAGLTDPQGAYFTIIESAGDPPGHDGPAGPGEISWHELATTSWEDAWAFYSELFDWQKSDAMEIDGIGTYQMFSRGAHPLGGLYDKPPHFPVPHWLLYVRVEEIDAALERVESGGGRILNGPEDISGGGRIAQCMDPQGAAFALHWGPEG